MLGLLGAGAQSSSLWESIVAFDTLISRVLALIAVGAWLRTRWKLRSVTQTQLRMSEELGSLRLNLTEAEKENEELAQERDDWMPRKWIDEAEKERASGNDAVAVDILDQGYQRVRGELGLVAHQLAEFHASRMIGFDATTELEAAQRLSTVARELAPNQREVTALARDLEGIEIVDGEPLQIASSRFDAADQTEAERVLRAVLIANQRLFSQGRYHVCILLCERAKRTAIKNNQANSELALQVTLKLIQALNFQGQDERALSEIDKFLSTPNSTLGARNPNRLGARFFKVQALKNLKLHEKALVEMDSLLELWEEVDGVNGPETQANRRLYAELLALSGHPKPALAEADLLKREIGESIDKLSPEASATMHLRAKILDELNRWEEALEQIDELLEIEKSKDNYDHPQTLSSRLLKAGILKGLEKRDRALIEVENTMLVAEPNVGRSHPIFVALASLKSELTK